MNVYFALPRGRPILGNSETVYKENILPLWNRMAWFDLVALVIIHALHIFWTCITTLVHRITPSTPLPVRAKRQKLPAHLTVVITETEASPSPEEKDAIVESVVRCVRWCKEAGIRNLSLYDRQGTILQCIDLIKSEALQESELLHSWSDCSSEASDLEYPPTPPLSDTSYSRPLSPERFSKYPSVVTMELSGRMKVIKRNVEETDLRIRRRRSTTKSSVESQEQSFKTADLTLSLFSYSASKPFLASLARSALVNELIEPLDSEDRRNTKVTIKNVDASVRDLFRLPCPDLMIVYSLKQNGIFRRPLELDGFPPWIMPLTEIFHDNTFSFTRFFKNAFYKALIGHRRVTWTYVALSETVFRQALDKFASAEMRFGK